MDRHEPALAAFLGGELDPAEVRAFDQHLLDCEPCWQALREDRLGRAAAMQLAEPAPPQLAERIRLAVELANPDRRRGRHLRWMVAAAAVISAALAATLIAVLHPSGQAEPAPVTAVVHYAQGPSTSAEQLVAGGQHIRLHTERLNGTTTVIATSNKPFDQPPHARTLPGPGMAWTATRGTLGLYYLNGPRPVLLAAPVSPDQLARLAKQLHLN
jgi:hypothetical protein